MPCQCPHPQVVLEPSDGGYTVTPALPGCISEADAKAEALRQRSGAGYRAANELSVAMPSQLPMAK
jgi:hypothetical protein